VTETTGPIKRRSFLGAAVASLLALAGGFVALLAGGFLYPVRKKKGKPIFVCLLSQVPKGSTRTILDPAKRKVILIHTKEGELLALSTTCTHLGCTVFYRPEKHRFDCPCHQGVFDGKGNPISGPPKRPLERYPVQIRNGLVFVQFD